MNRRWYEGCPLECSHQFQEHLATVLLDFAGGLWLY